MHILEWTPNTDLRELARSAALALSSGKLALLPSEMGYVATWSADAFVSANETASPMTMLTNEADRKALVLPDPYQIGSILSNPLACRLLRRLTPGQVLVSLPEDEIRLTRNLPGKDKGRLSCWIPAHAIFQSVLQELAQPVVVLFSPVPANTLDVWNSQFGASEGVSINAGSLMLEEPTLIRVDGRSWTRETPGALSEPEIMMAAAEWIVFVCTGNTCRSPMAEALMKTALARRLGTTPAELVQCGYRVLSAGIAAAAGNEPSPEAVEIVHAMGGSLREHRSQPLHADLVAEADHLVAMTRNHLLTVLTRYPIVGGSLRLLCGVDGDLDDPIGGGIEIYQDCAATINHHIERILREWHWV